MTESHSAGLLFRTRDGNTVVAPEPAIGGQDSNMSSGVVSIIYDPADPRKAALASQLHSSPWAGAATGSLISAALLTAGLPVLVWLLIRRLRVTGELAGIGDAWRQCPSDLRD
jgi:hypothetical protein